MKQRRWIYAPEFRQQLVELVKAGRKPSELAQEFGCHDTSISVWVRQAKADEQGGLNPTHLSPPPNVKNSPNCNKVRQSTAQQAGRGVDTVVS